MIGRQVQTRAEALAGDIETRIVEGGFGPGQMIGTIEELKKQSGFARSTVGEAIRLLSDRGVAEVRPGRGGGVYVKSDHPVVRMRRTLLSVTERPGSVFDAIAVRDALEALVDVDAARHRTEQDIADIKALMEELSRALLQGLGPFLDANWRLHGRIAEITPNAMARDFYLSALDFIKEHAASAQHDNPATGPGYLQIRLQVHQELVDAIASGDTHRTHLAVITHRGALMS
ncbi:FadR/GntR family transcriptional regulator [Ancylobacter sp. IITR112]|uniref:FadR/GntR family transcriptional regulator n=1 Tax=Ancylobacter sp. IITR112 TaxID=3138073 RepID=UPI00352A7D8C